MLWALLALYFFSSSGAPERAAFVERLKTFVRSEVQEPARRTELLAVIERAEQTTKDQLAVRGRIVRDLAAISEKHATRTAAIEQVLDRYRVAVEAYQERMIRHRFELKGKMSREEWARAFPAPEPAPPAGEQAP
mgnify:CR=1 FL=1